MDIEAWLRAIAAPVVGVIAGGYFVNRFFVRKANLASVVDRTCETLEDLRENCATYWSSSYCDDKVSELAALEGKVKAGVLQVGALFSLAWEKYRTSNLLSDTVRQEIIELQDLCTGGAFETKDLCPDRYRFMKITSQINKLQTAALKLKL